MLKRGFHARVVAAHVTAACCLALPHDPMEDYFQRRDGVTFGAGNAKSSNSVQHIIDPWPPYVANTRIPGNGQRMQGAIERYRDVSKLPDAPKPIQTEYGTTINIIGGSKQ